MTNVTVMWLCCVDDRPVGLVKAWDEFEERWHYYIGTGHGMDLEEDVERIMECGQKFYDLSFIQEFCKDKRPEKQLSGQIDVDELMGEKYVDLVIKEVLPKMEGESDE